MRHHLSLFVLMALSRSGLALAAEPDGPDATTEAARDQAVADDLWAWVARLDGAPLPEEAEAERVEEAASERSARALADAPGGVDLAEDLLADPGRALAGDPLFLDKIDLSEFDLPVVVNDHVEKWMRILLGPQRKYMQRWLERKARFEPMITAKVDAAGLPRDLIYLSMIESGFSPYALSSASAAGLWQFISSTGRMYDLRVDFWVDERRDPELATDAALRMLADLHRMFDDWFLAFAGYNTGPGRVKRALGRASKDDADYWTLLEEDLIHRETQGYVPKILAAAIISKHPERYGFTDLQPHEPLVYDTVEVEGSIDLVVLAECAGIDEEALRALNPALLQRTTPSGTTRLRVPTGGGEAFLAALAEVPPEARRTLVTHVVQRGESLSGIAARYGLTASALASANGIRDVHRIAVGQRLVVPVSGGATATSRATASAAPASPKPPPPAPAVPASREGTSSAAASSPRSMACPRRISSRGTVSSTRAPSRSARRFGSPRRPPPRLRRPRGPPPTSCSAATRSASSPPATACP
jgi:soluble lytic murein transglycosylase-like protein/LysM repeat protein